MKKSWVRPEWLVCGLLLLASSASGSMGQPKKPEPGTQDERLDPASDSDAELVLEPDLAFLEYLGTLVKDGETWVGPDDMPAPADEATRESNGGLP